MCLARARTSILRIVRGRMRALIRYREKPRPDGRCFWDLDNDGSADHAFEPNGKEHIRNTVFFVLHCNPIVFQ